MSWCAFELSMLLWPWHIQNKNISQQHDLSTHLLELLEFSALCRHWRQVLDEWKGNVFHWLERTYAIINFLFKLTLPFWTRLEKMMTKAVFNGIAFGHPRLDLRKISSAPLYLTSIWIELIIFFLYTQAFLFSHLQKIMNAKQK